MSNKKQYMNKRIQPVTGSFFNYPKPKKVWINEQLHLVSFKAIRAESYPWYQEPESMKDIVGKPVCYTENQIEQMYRWQNEHGWLYYIEYKQKDRFQTIGDVWLGEDDYALVLDKAFRGQHIGRKVTKYFIHKSQRLGRDYFLVSEIFNWNKASQKMFTQLKFYPYKENQDSWSYRKKLF